MNLQKIISVILLCVCVHSAQALIVYGESNADASVKYDSSSTQAELSVVYLSKGTSAVYLGNGWFITAKHSYVDVGTSIYQNGQKATVDYTDSFLNENYGLDLAMFHSSDISSFEYLTPINLDASIYDNITDVTYKSNFFSQSYTKGTSVTLVGAGYGRTDTSELTDTQVMSDQARGVIRSGESCILFSPDNSNSFATGYYITMAEASTGGVAAQKGDSGSGMFVEVNGTWYLLGINVQITKPSETAEFDAYFGNYEDAYGTFSVTYSALLSNSTMTMALSLESYVDEIKNVVAINPIPEPATYVLFASLSVLGVVFYKRRK